MDKSMLIGVVAGAVAVTAIGGVAGYKVLHPEPTYADVVNVQPVTKDIRTAHKVCKEVPVTRQAPVRDQDRIAGTAIGAVLGGVLGNQIGGGNGKTVATVAGAAAGGYAGNRVQKSMQESDRQTVMDTRCRTEYSNQKKILGYNVTYHLGEKQGVVRMDYDPGQHIPVRDGQLVLTPPVNENPS
ncbi:glycine zipper 2TM domain-containing protein [Sulfuriferula plumbiphila]|nr:glycine zipper 2TM domain-containing protein [Sulfuriferula plumbiphila]